HPRAFPGGAPDPQAQVAWFAAAARPRRGGHSVQAAGQHVAGSVTAAATPRRLRRLISVTPTCREDGGAGSGRGEDEGEEGVGELARPEVREHLPGRGAPGTRGLDGGAGRAAHRVRRVASGGGGGAV